MGDQPDNLTIDILQNDKERVLQSINFALQKFMLQTESAAEQTKILHTKAENIFKNKKIKKMRKVINNIDKI